jgi:hypothetical protein
MAVAGGETGRGQSERGQGMIHMDRVLVKPAERSKQPSPRAFPPREELQRACEAGILLYRQERCALARQTKLTGGVDA